MGRTGENSWIEPLARKNHWVRQERTLGGGQERVEGKEFGEDRNEPKGGAGKIHWLERTLERTIGEDWNEPVTRFRKSNARTYENLSRNARVHVCPLWLVE